MPTPLSNEEINDIEEIVSMADQQFSPWARRRITDLIFSLRYYMNEAEANSQLLEKLVVRKETKRDAAG